MAIIYTYPEIKASKLSSDDKLILADMSVMGFPTMSVTLKDLATFITGTGSGTGTTDVLTRWTDGPSGLLGDSIVAQDAGATALTVTGDFIATGTGNFTGQVTIPLTPLANTDSASKGYVDTEIAGIPAGLIFQGNWDARNIAEGGASDQGDPDLATPALKVTGHYYVVTTAGSAAPNGPATTPNSWNIGDWVVFIEQGATDRWEKIDQTFVAGSGATGQVTFWDSTNTVTGDNDLFWDNTNKRLGIGDSTPTYKLEVVDDVSIIARFKSTTDSAGITVQDNDSRAYVYAKDDVASFGPLAGNTTQNLRIKDWGGSTTTMGFGSSAVDNKLINLREDVSTDDDESKYGIGLDFNVSGTAAVTGDRTMRGIHLDMDSSSTGGDTADEVRLYGIEGNVNDTGDADSIMGARGLVYSNMTLPGTTANLVGSYGSAIGANTNGTMTQVTGVQGYVAADNAGGAVAALTGVKGTVTMTSDSDKVVNNAYGAFFKVDTTSAAGGGMFTNSDGIRVEVEMDSPGTMTSARGFYSIIDSNAGTITSAYQFYGTTTVAGTITNNWGLYSIGALKNYLEGTLRLPSYGSGSNTGTKTNDLAVDASGNVIEVGRNIFTSTSLDTTTNYNVNATETPVVWDSEIIKDSIYTHDNAVNPEQVTVTEAGTYRIYSMLTATSPIVGGGAQRTQVILRIAVNGTSTARQGRGMYLRSASGHQFSSAVIEEIMELSVNDIITITGERGTNQGAVINAVASASFFSIQKLF